jgi:hypothetical protein
VATAGFGAEDFLTVHGGCDSITVDMIIFAVSSCRADELDSGTVSWRRF